MCKKFFTKSWWFSSFCFPMKHFTKLFACWKLFNTKSDFKIVSSNRFLLRGPNLFSQFVVSNIRKYVLQIFEFSCFSFYCLFYIPSLKYCSDKGIFYLPMKGSKLVLLSAKIISFLCIQPFISCCLSIVSLAHKQRKDQYVLKTRPCSNRAMIFNSPNKPDLY